MIVVDTNILVYSTFEDSENHSEALEIIEKEDVKIPQIVVYEFYGF
nr:PIN domain-containing protein [Sulfuracidifex metallicus]